MGFTAQPRVLAQESHHRLRLPRRAHGLGNHALVRAPAVLQARSVHHLLLAQHLPQGLQRCAALLGPPVEDPAAQLIPARVSQRPDHGQPIEFVVQG